LLVEVVAWAGICLMHKTPNATTLKVALGGNKGLMLWIQLTAPLEIKAVNSDHDETV